MDKRTEKDREDSTGFPPATTAPDGGAPLEPGGGLKVETVMPPVSVGDASAEEPVDAPVVEDVAEEPVPNQGYPDETKPKP